MSLVLLPLLALLALAPAADAHRGPTSSGLDGPAKESTRYEGRIVLHPSSGTTSVPFEFGISDKGGRVGPFTIPNGAPGAPGCEVGPLGYPAPKTAPISPRGRFSVSLRLVLEDQPQDHGSVRVSGRFLASGEARGKIETVGTTSQCDGSFRWTAEAR